MCIKHTPEKFFTFLYIKTKIQKQAKKKKVFVKKKWIMNMNIIETLIVIQ